MPSTQDDRRKLAKQTINAWSHKSVIPTEEEKEDEEEDEEGNNDVAFGPERPPRWEVPFLI